MTARATARRYGALALVLVLAVGAAPGCVNGDPPDLTDV
jgi:hypothetical protein